MKKIYITILIGILILGLAAAATVHFGLDKKDFTIKVNKISAEKFCEKISEQDKEKEKFSRKIEPFGYNIFEILLYVQSTQP